VIVVATGGRDYADAAAVNLALDALDDEGPVRWLYHGSAKGADWLAHDWAGRRNIPIRGFIAQWDTEGRAAGPWRNARMLAEAKQHAEREDWPLVVLAFPGGRGTANCVWQAQELGIEVRTPLSERPDGT
jgi:hypothetical protein